MASPWLVPIGDLLRHPGNKRDATAAGVLNDVAVTASRVPANTESTFSGTLESLDGGERPTA